MGDDVLRGLLQVDRVLVAEAIGAGADEASVRAFAETLRTLPMVCHEAGTGRAEAVRTVAFKVLLSLVKDSPIEGHRVLAALLARELEVRRETAAKASVGAAAARRAYSEPAFAAR
jgi:hypothetical protein